jgi:putative ABC transport system permease protein
VYLKLALRRLIKTPFVTAIATISLALGIGANAGIFSIFDQTLLQALPVPDPDRLVNFVAPGPKPGSQSCGQAGDCDAVFSYGMFRDLAKAQTVFTGIAAHVAFGANLAYRGQTISGDGLHVSGSYFPILGVRAEIGRLLDDNDDSTPGTHFVTVLSHAFWTSKLGGTPSVLNDTIIVNGQSLTIVGVAARGFKSTTLGTEPEVFVPISMREQLSPGWKGFEDRRSYWAYLFARLKPGVSIDQARTAMDGVYRPIITDVEAPLQKGMSDQTMGRFRTKPLMIEPGYRGQSSVHGQARTPMILLLSVTGIVLLIACANIANLLLARAAGRSTEMAVRLSIGASRRQLLTQLLTESCVLAVLGGIAGLVVARWTLASIATLLPPDASQTLSFELRGNVILFAAALSIATGLFFGLFPALHSTRPDLVSTLKAQAGQPSGARAASRFRTSLVTVQIALSMALLIAAGLFIKSLTNIARVDLGLKTDNVVTFRTSPVLSGYDQAKARVFFDRAEQEMAAIPGVTGVALSRVPLLAGSNSGNDVSVEGFASGPDTDTNSRMNEISAGYFRTLGIPLLAGREFTIADTTGAPKVAIVNEAFAQKFKLGREAVGKRMAIGGGTNLDIEIVGLVQNAKYSQVKQQVPPIYFLPHRQAARVGSPYFYVRTSVSPESLLRDAPAAIARLDPNLPVENLKTLPQQVRQNTFLDRFVGTLSASFAILATILAAVGLYGVLAYTVSQRTREIGLRMALGADRSRVRAMVLRQVAVMTLVGGVIGIAAAIAIGMSAQSLLFEMKGYDPAVIGIAALVLCVVALAAGYIPAHRASRVDPMLALRYE